jgi:hypothetical protein
MNTTMNPGERRALVAGLARRLRRLALVTCREGHALAGPEPPARRPPDPPAKGGR